MEFPPDPNALSAPESHHALARWAFLRPVLEDGVALTEFARTQHIPLRTLQRWVARFRSHGLRGLLRTPRKDRDTIALPALQIQCIEGLALRTPPLSMAAIHRQIVALASQHQWPIPSYDTVVAVIHAIPADMKVLAHAGTAAYHDQYDLLHRHEAEAPNVLWQADHTPLDIYILTEHHTAARPWLTVIVDDYSRAVAGYLLSFQAPSTIHTALALRQAIWRKADPQWPMCGIPTTLYTDHGSDFTSRHLEAVAVDIGMRLSFSQPPQPRGRGKIERLFQTINQLFLCTQPGYTPEGYPAAAASLTFAQFDQALRAFLLNEYHQRTHGETDQTPQARRESGGFLPRMPDSLEQLDTLLLTVAKPRKVHRDGIRFQSFRYMDLTLAAFVGESIVIRYDPRDLAEIRVYHENRFLCRAICYELAGQTVPLKDVIQARQRRYRTVRERVTDRQRIIDTLLPMAPPPNPSPSVDAPEPTGPRLKRYLYDE